MREDRFECSRNFRVTKITRKFEAEKGFTGLHGLQGRSVDGVIHILDSLLDLELLGVELVFEFIDGG